MTSTTTFVNRWMVGAVLLGTVGCNSSPVAPEEFTPPPGADYSIDFGEVSSFTVTPGHVLALRLKVRREDGFEAPIDLAAQATPGIVVIFRPERVIHLDESDLLVVADASTPRRTHQIEFTAASEGHPTMTTVLSLTVVDPE